MKINLHLEDQWVVGSGLLSSELTDEIKTWMDEHGVTPASTDDGWYEYHLDGDLEVLFKLRWL